MQGYVWAKTTEGALFVVMVTDQGGFVPGREDAIDLSQITLLEPIAWPSQFTAPNPDLAPRSRGARAAVAARECDILPFVARG